MKFAIGVPHIFTFLTILSLHPVSSVTTSLTLYVPPLVYVWDGCCNSEALASPEEGSPKSQRQLFIVPIRLVEASVKFAVLVEHILSKVKLAETPLFTSICRLDLHPLLSVTTSVYVPDPAVIEEVETPVLHLYKYGVVPPVTIGIIEVVVLHAMLIGELILIIGDGVTIILYDLIVIPVVGQKSSRKVTVKK